MFLTLTTLQPFLPFFRALRAAVVAGSITPDFAFINAALVPGVRGLTLAAFAARAAALRRRSRSRSPYTELLLALSGVRNIGAALATFGLSDEARHLVVCRFDPEDGDGAAAAAAVQGTLAPLEELDSVRDEGAMRKVEWSGCGWEEGRGESGGLKPFATCRLTRSPTPPQPQAFRISDDEVGPLDSAAFCRMAAREC